MLFNRFTFTKEYKKIELALLERNIIVDKNDVVAFNLCDLKSSIPGRFDYTNNKIDICVNHVESERQLNKILFKTFLQFYDFNMNGGKPFNSQQQYCSLIRANSLSKQCNSSKDLQGCIKNTVEDDIRILKKADKLVFDDEFNNVYNICIKDIAPFEIDS